MPLYCKKCKEELKHVTWMKAHVEKCYGEARKTGAFENQWMTAELHPQEMADLYFQITNPADAIVDQYRPAKDVIWDALYHDGVRPSVQEELKSYLSKPVKLAGFEYANFRARMAISGTVQDSKVYYRKISQAEWNATQQRGANPFKVVFDFMNSDLYRYWMSSSLQKVNLFGNENATDDGNIVVKISFKTVPVNKFTIAAHQQQGVQGNTKVVAIHREGFADIGSVSTENHVKEITKVDPVLDHNLGFTSAQLDDMKQEMASFTRIV